MSSIMNVLSACNWRRNLSFGARTGLGFGHGLKSSWRSWPVLAYRPPQHRSKTLFTSSAKSCPSAGSVGNIELRQKATGESYAALSEHQGAIDANHELAYAVFGSGSQQMDPGDMAEQGVPSQQETDVMMREVASFPPFCGGANGHEDTQMAEAEHQDEALEDRVQHTEQAPLDSVLQNLQCRLGNPRNRCFANAPFWLWAWTGSFLSGPKLWNRTTAAVLAALTDDEVVQITKLQTLDELWRRFDDSIQDDASYFLSEMVELAQPKQVSTHYFQVDLRQQVHRRKEFPTHLLFPLWVVQIGRYKLDDGIRTKHHQVLNVPSIFNLPITEDGHTTKTEQYSLLGLLCHSGTAHQSGHFFAVYAYRSQSCKTP